MKVTNNQTYIMVPAIEAPITCTFYNRAGGWSSIQLTKYRDVQVKTEPEYFRTLDHERVAAVSSRKKITYYTQWLDSSYYEYMNDLLHSPYIYINGKYVKVLDHSHKYDSLADLYQFELEVAPKYEENKIKV
jgi:hypothetical protein